jgi:uncharacterized protein (TIGR03437 family)
MTRTELKYLQLGALIFGALLTPALRGQTGSSVSHVVTFPDGAFYQIDGQTYRGGSSSLWPDGSKHLLWAPLTQNPPGVLKALLSFNHWELNGVPLPTNPVAITASGSVAEYKVVFDVAYAISLVFFSCPDPASCASPGTIYVNNAPYNSNTDIYVSANSAAILQAIPNPGYVFVGWKPGNGQAINGLQNIVTVNTPIEVYPQFQVARKINLATDPPNLSVFADRVSVLTPVALDWGYSTTHTVGAVSPQQDLHGKYWAFKSWSDGGAVNHAYNVAPISATDTVTATYVPAAGVTLLTQPAGLKLKVDGLTAVYNPNFFTWGVGETHHLEAPAQQTDAQGRIWQFTAWSNVNSAVQDYTVPLDADTAGGARLTATYRQLARLSVDSSMTALSVNVDGAPCVTPCDVVREIGATVRLSVPASIPQGNGSRADFDGWPGGVPEYAITLAADPQRVTAGYHQMNRFTAASDPPNGASWSVQPASADGFYGTQATVAVNLTTQPGFRFRRWDGDLTGTIPSGYVAMSAPRTVRALLDPVPYIAPAGVANAAGSTPSAAVAPGSIVSIFGANLATDVIAAPSGMLPQSLAGATVRVAERLLPMVFASPGQINAFLPDDLPEGRQILSIAPPGQAEVRATFIVLRNAPGLFAGVFHEDGSAVTAESPARTDELLTVYGTGFGPADHTRLEGFPIPATPTYLIADAVSAQLGDTAIVPEKAFAVPGKIGIDAVQFRLPDGARSGAFKITINGQESNSVTLPVQ